MYVIPLTRTVSRARPLPADSTPVAFARAVDRLIDESFDRVRGQSGTRLPAVDVRESDTHYIVVADLPGVDKSQLAVSVEGRVVGLETTPAEAPKSEDRVLYGERRAPRYARKLALPSEVDADATEARLENGVLTLTLAKKAADRVRRIEVA